MKCSKCGARMPTGLAICPECGASQGRKIRYVRCRNCGAKVPRGLHICPQCGRVPTLRGRVSLLVVAVVLGIALGIGATFAGGRYVSDVRYRLGVMLLDASGRGTAYDGGQPSPTATPLP
jgi:RNA polymerase subunit RPABC4/transcription elongation factor Spt4